MTVFFLLLLGLSTTRAEVTNIPQIGPHYRILTVEKNENPQNILALYTKLNSDCDIDHHGPALGFYWLMDGQRFKPVHPLIRRGIEHRLEVYASKANSFTIGLSDLKELQNDVGNAAVRVSARSEGGHCTVQALFTLGPSDGGQTLRLTKIHSNSAKTFLPPFRKIVSVTLEGVNIDTGLPVKRVYSAKN